MECNYVNPPGQNWYVIQWKRRNNGTDPETIVTLQNNFLTEVYKLRYYYLLLAFWRGTKLSTNVTYNLFLAKHMSLFTCMYW